MSDVLIRAEGLGKRYRIGRRAERGYVALRDVATEAARGLLRSARDALAGRPLVAGDSVEDFWALSGVDLELRRGEACGVIGRNGAGKSTLLKVLSRITEPSAGRVSIRGRLASLLEVGTGFHPELTGRENIFLNGAILGMTRAEVRAKFDAIVAFAEVGAFLDTPVKRYSSGMYVRLAFAVAAHLEPDVLVVDEVLAVGDSAFQRKCLDKMGEASGQGRAVLFVSHNMGAVRALCSRAILLDGGRVVARGTPEAVAQTYLAGEGGEGSRRAWATADAPGDDAVRLLALAVSQDGRPPPFSSGRPIEVAMTVEVARLETDLNVGYQLTYQSGETAFWSHHSDAAPDAWPALREGVNRLVCEIPSGLLNAGRYSVSPAISVHARRWIVSPSPRLGFDVYLDHSSSPYWTSQSDGRRQGPLAPVLPWRGEAA